MMIELGKQQCWTDTFKLRFATGFKYRKLCQRNQVKDWLIFIRLEAIFKYLRILNFLWLIHSTLIEFSLNFNNVTAVLGGLKNNELHLPGQLLPLLIGAFGFVRTSYFVLESWHSPGDIQPPLSEPSPPHAASIMHARDLPLAFSPAMARRTTTISHDPDEIDELERGRRCPVRYLVAWIPWLSLIKWL
jgi:hypothetical protein